MSAWFGDRASIDLRPGGAAQMTFAQLPDDSRRKTYDSHAEGWTRELGDLAGYLDAA